jgi:formamidopyrimidine-DNA glycosylase
MPELPEVETIARRLREGGMDSPQILGKTIDRVTLLWERTLASPTALEFKRQITGQKIIDVQRRGKYIHLPLSESHLLVHLGMSGDLVVGGGGEPLGKYLRLVVFMHGGLVLSFTDSRKFGRVWLVDDPDMVLGKLGIEPFDDKLTEEKFYELLHSRRRQIKPMLMDQKVLAGMGNIYTDEALYLAKIHPKTLSNQLNSGDSAGLLRSIRKVLQDGIHTDGASIDWVYRGGDFQNYFHVYQRKGEPCTRCGTPIRHLLLHTLSKP